MIVLPAAELEAAEAALWYDDQRQGLGDEFLDELKAAFQKIAKSPEQSPKFEHYAGGEEVRRYLMKRFPYLVVFVCRPSGLAVIAICHVRRRPDYWLDRLKGI